MGWKVLLVLSRELPLVSRGQWTHLRLLWRVERQICISLPLEYELLLHLGVKQCVNVHAPDSAASELEPESLTACVHK